MNGSSSRRSKEELDYTCEHEEAGIASDASPPPGGSAGDESKKVHFLERSSASEPSPKRSRRTMEKRVVTVRNSEAKKRKFHTKLRSGKGGPPADSWAWRKYGQKPIKGSPYPRGYYRCSSSKGCPARKQVERSQLDPTIIMVTYSFDHNHPWPQPKSHHHKHIEAAAAVAAQPAEDPPEQIQLSPPESAEPEEKFTDLISEEDSALLVHATQWFPEVCSTASTSTSTACSSEMLYGSVFFSGVDTAATAVLPEEREDAEAVGGGGGEDDSLFAGLGELPEYSVVLRRRFTSASWVGSTE